MSKRQLPTGLAGVGKRQRIQGWLMQEGWQISDAQAENAAWTIAATNPHGQGVVVVQPQQVSDVLVLQASVKVDASFHETFAAIEQTKRDDLLWNVRFGLLQMGVEFAGLDDPPRQLVLTQRIYNDGLTKDAFVQRMMQVRNATLFAVWSITRGLQRPPDSWPESIH